MPRLRLVTRSLRIGLHYLSVYCWSVLQYCNIIEEERGIE